MQIITSVHHRHFPSRELSTMALVAVSALSAPALAGGGPVLSIAPLVLEGDAIPGVGAVTTINNIAVNNSGTWLVELDTDGATTSDLVLLRDGAVIGQEGSPVPPPPATLSSFDSITLNDNGESGYNFFLDGTTGTTDDSGVYFGPGRLPFEAILVYQESDIAPDLSPNTPFIGWFDVKINNARELLLVSSVDDPAIATTVDRALQIIQLDAAGAVIGTSLLAKEGDLLAGQTETVADFGTGPHASAINDDGDVMFVADLNGATTADGVVYLNSTVLGQEGQPSPVAGRNWLTLTSARLDVNNNGGYVHTGTLAGDTATDLLISRNGAKFIQEGDTLPAIAGFTFTAFGSGPVEIADNGRVLWFGDWTDPITTQDTGLFLDDQLIVQEGVTVISGQTVLSLSGVEDGYHMSSDGSKIVAELTLADGTSGVFLITVEQPPAIVDCITYTSPHSRILEVTISVVDEDDDPLAGADVSIHLTGSNGVDITTVGTTGVGGTILFTRRITAACYTTDVTNIVKSGYAFDGAEPINGHQKNVDTTPDADCRSASDLCGGGLEDMPQDCPDIDESGAVDADDLLAVISDWGSCPALPTPCPANLITTGASVEAGRVDVDDLLAVLSAWGACP